jgi:hypothetical protein
MVNEMKLQRYEAWDGEGNMAGYTPEDDGMFVKADEAEAEIEAAKDVIVALQGNQYPLEEQLAKAEKVLKMYANEKNWFFGTWTNKKCFIGIEPAQDYFKDKEVR